MHNYKLRVHHPVSASMAEEATAAEVPTDTPKANAQEESANDTAQQALDLARQAAALKVADATADGGNGAGGGSKKKKKKKKGKKKAAVATVGSGWDDDDANAASGGADSGPIDGADGGSADAEEGGEPDLEAADLPLGTVDLVADGGGAARPEHAARAEEEAAPMADLQDRVQAVAEVEARRVAEEGLIGVDGGAGERVGEEAADRLAGIPAEEELEAVGPHVAADVGDAIAAGDDVGTGEHEGVGEEGVLEPVEEPLERDLDAAALEAGAELGLDGALEAALDHDL